MRTADGRVAELHLVAASGLVGAQFALVLSATALALAAPVVLAVGVSAADGLTPLLVVELVRLFLHLLQQHLLLLDVVVVASRVAVDVCARVAVVVALAAGAVTRGRLVVEGLLLLHGVLAALLGQVVLGVAAAHGHRGRGVAVAALGVLLLFAAALAVSTLLFNYKLLARVGVDLRDLGNGLLGRWVLLRLRLLVFFEALLGLVAGQLAVRGALRQGAVGTALAGGLANLV